MWRACPCRLRWISFGLNREYYHKVLKDIDYIVRNSNGGYTFSEVYSFPIWLRRLTLRTISDEIRESNKKIEEANNKARQWGNKDLKTLKDRMNKDTTKKTPNKPFITSAGKK